MPIDYYREEHKKVSDYLDNLEKGRARFELETIKEHHSSLAEKISRLNSLKKDIQAWIKRIEKKLSQVKKKKQHEEYDYSRVSELLATMDKVNMILQNLSRNKLAILQKQMTSLDEVKKQIEKLKPFAFEQKLVFKNIRTKIKNGGCEKRMIKADIKSPLLDEKTISAVRKRGSGKVSDLSQEISHFEERKKKLLEEQFHNEEKMSELEKEMKKILRKKEQAKKKFYAVIEEFGGKDVYKIKKDIQKYIKGGE